MVEASPSFCPLQVVERLLAHDSTCVQSPKPMMRACMHGYREITEILLLARARLDLADEMGITPLMMAARFGQVECVCLLLEKMREEGGGFLSLPSSGGRMVVDQPDKSGYTSLMRGAGHGHVQVTIELLKSIPPSSVSAADQKGLTALMNACRNGHTSTLSLLLRKTSLEVQREVLNARDERGETALFKVCPVCLLFSPNPSSSLPSPPILSPPLPSSLFRSSPLLSLSSARLPSSPLRSAPLRSAALLPSPPLATISLSSPLLPSVPLCSAPLPSPPC